MNLVALLFGMLNPLLAFPIALNGFTKRRKPIICAVLMAFTMAYVAYYYQSRYVGDLERYVNLLSLYRGIPLSDCFDRFYSGLYALDVFFWFSSRLSDARLLVMIVAFILYFITFYILLDYFSRREDLETKHIIVIITLTIALLPFYDYISSFRSSLALSFGAVALYREYVKGKRSVISYLLYVLPVLFHLAGAFIIVIRLAMLIKGKKQYFIWAIIGILVALLGSGIFNGFRFIGGFFADISDKMLEYSAYGNMMNSAWFQAVRSSLTASLKKALCAEVLLLVAWKGITTNDAKQNEDETAKLHKVGICSSLIILGMMFFPTTIYARFYMGLMPFTILSIYQIEENGIIKKTALASATIGMFAIQIHTMVDNVMLTDFAKSILLGILNFLS